MGSNPDTPFPQAKSFTTTSRRSRSVVYKRKSELKTKYLDILHVYLNTPV